MMFHIRYVLVLSYFENLSISLISNSKLIEQLKVYYTKWKLLSHIKETLSLSAEVRKPLSLVIHDPLRSTRAPAIPQNQLRLHHATKGLLDIPTTPSNSRSIVTATHPLPNIPMEVDFHPASGPPTSSASVTDMVDTNGTTMQPLSAIPTNNNRTQTELLARQRVADSVARAKPIEVPRKRRTCRKCAIFGCPGSQKVSNCRNPCRDCNSVSCRGRNPKRLDKTCAHGWD